MNSHILIKYSNRAIVPSEPFLPQNCTYNHRKGYWISNDTGDAMMLSDYDNKPISKKWDRETGEDQKGE